MGFLFVYLAVYGGMNLFVLARFFQGFGGRLIAWLVPAATMILLVFLPIILHTLGEDWPIWARRLVAFTAFIWMALALWLATSQFPFLAWNALARLLNHYGWFAGRIPIVNARAVVIAAMAFAVFGSVWGYFEAGRIRVRRFVIDDAKAAAGAVPLRVVQITDVHLGLTSRTTVLERILNTVARERPDVLVATGDLVDAADPFLDAWLDRFASLDAPLGKYAVVGNHEVYPELRQALLMLRRAGFTVLRQTAVDVGPRLRLVGVDDPAARRRESHAAADGSPPEPLTVPMDDQRFTILLKHRPTPTPDLVDAVDLQLSGHAHDGQIFPFGWFVRLVYNVPHGRIFQPAGSPPLYVSRGTGTWGPPFRLFCPPEVTVFDIGSGSRNHR